MGRILFLSAVAYLAYRYIGRSNQKARREVAAKPGTIEILPPSQAGPRESAAETLPAPKRVARLSAAVETDAGLR